MKITGVIAEYNPFHNGHKAMLEQCRKDGADGIVAVMSGNFVQRGSVAIMDKRSRAAAALRGGADLVVELPVPWATATAEVFADGGVRCATAPVFPVKPYTMLKIEGAEAQIAKLG